MDTRDQTSWLAPGRPYPHSQNENIPRAPRTRPCHAPSNKRGR